MIEEQDWTEAYKELCNVIRPEDPEKGVPEVKHCDLYHGQIEHAEDDYPWPPSSVFFDFNAVDIKTIGQNVQEMLFAVEVIYAVDLLADTYQKSQTQDISLMFMATCKRIHQVLQGKSGKHYGTMNRVGFRRMPSHPSLMVIAQRYETIIMDYSGMKVEGEATVTGFKTKKGEAPGFDPDKKWFETNL